MGFKNINKSSKIICEADSCGNNKNATPYHFAAALRRLNE